MSHNLNEHCQVDGYNIDDYGDFENVNIFNFYGPILGDIYGFVDQILCENGDEAACHDNDDGGHGGYPDPLKPAVSITGYRFNDGDD